MISKKYLKGGVLTTIGYVLSPLSWWNDAFINIPLAYLFGLLFGLVSKSLFVPFMIVGYWLTNITGLILLHKGLVKIAAKEEKKYTKKSLIKDLSISILYTLVIVLLIYFRVIKFPS